MRFWRKQKPAELSTIEAPKARVRTVTMTPDQMGRSAYDRGGDIVPGDPMYDVLRGTPRSGEVTIINVSPLAIDGRELEACPE